MEELNKEICFSEVWNMKGNTRDFLSAEKLYRDAYAKLIESSEFEISDNNHTEWLAQEVKNPKLFTEYIEKADDLLSIIRKIVPQNKKTEVKILDLMNINKPNNSFMSCICFHSALSNICEFVHLHRWPARYKAAASLVGVANKQLGLGAIHYIRILITLINLTQREWIMAGAIEVAKVIGKNMCHRECVSSTSFDLEHGIGLAELAYENHSKSPICVLTPVNLEIDKSLEIEGRFQLPLHLGGYIAHCKCYDGYIIGFRGSKNWKNWLTNATQQLVGISLIYMVALGLVLKMKEKYGSQLLVVGHSLGGGLTQFAVAGLNDAQVKGVGYNSAGLSNMAADLLKNNYQGGIFHLHLRIDQVFLIGNQLGGCYDQMNDVKNPVRAHLINTMRAMANGIIPYYMLK